MADFYLDAPFATELKQPERRKNACCLKCWLSFFIMASLVMGVVILWLVFSSPTQELDTNESGLGGFINMFSSINL